MKNRGIYGQNDGSFVRGGKDAANILGTEKMFDNDIAEGDIVKHLKVLVRGQRWQSVSDYCDDLKRQGYAGNRVDAMLCMATAGLKF